MLSRSTTSMIVRSSKSANSTSMNKALFTQVAHFSERDYHAKEKYGPHDVRRHFKYGNNGGDYYGGHWTGLVEDEKRRHYHTKLRDDKSRWIFQDSITPPALQYQEDTKKHLPPYPADTKKYPIEELYNSIEARDVKRCVEASKRFAARAWGGKQIGMIPEGAGAGLKGLMDKAKDAAEKAQKK